jgi:hypothetical protein
VLVGGDPNTKEESTCTESDKVHTYTRPSLVGA